MLQACLLYASSIPSLNNLEFKAKLERWVELRGKGKAPADKDWERFFRDQIDWLNQYASPVAVGILDYSIRNGYTGLIEPKGSPVAPQAPNPSAGVNDAEWRAFLASLPMAYVEHQFAPDWCKTDFRAWRKSK